jgi:GNAT superfamily N-acetyltransferase
MPFADLALARRIDAAEASLSAQIGEAAARRDPAAGHFVRPVAGGVAVCTGAQSPITKVIGVGFEGLPDETELEAVERAFRERGAPVRAEVATLADPALCALLSRRGYLLEGFENVLGRAIGADDAADASVPGIEVAKTEEARPWIDVVIEGFEHPDAGVVSAPGESFPREALERAYADTAASGGFSRYLARMGDVPVGGAAMRLDGTVAQLCGAATRPAFRRRGVQTAMLKTRLRDAARAGCDIAVVTTQPGSRSQQNVQGRGFALLYSRAILVKPS